jgi:uncharacterized protein YndB with AHSA1/START domain
MDAMAAKASTSADREMVITRLVDAPPERVFEAWTDPEQVVQWWGPRGFTTTTYKMDVRPGGVWRFVMHGPYARDYQNKITYVEVVRPERLVYKHGGDDEGLEPVSFQTTVTFVPQGKKTMVTLRAVFPTPAERDRVIKEYGALEGGKQTLERLDEHLSAAAGSSPSSEFVISRVFDAPRDLVWQAHSELDRMKHWWGPKGFTWLTGTLDFRLGGMFHYGVRSPKGDEMWGRFVYREIVKPERIVFINSFSDANGGITRAPFAGNWPLEVLNTLTLTERDGKTTLNLRGGPINATENERKMFVSMFRSMEQGFGGTFDQLAAYLAKTA